MENEVELTEIANKEICPEGWRRYDGKLVAGDTCPVLSYMGLLFVPKSRQPRTWKGTVRQLGSPYCPVRWCWDYDMIVEVTEVRQSG